MNKRKTKFFSILLLFIIMFLGVKTIDATSAYKFGLEFIDYDVVKDGYAIGTKKFGDRPVEPGSNVQLDFNYLEAGKENLRLIHLIVEYNKDQLELLYDEGEGDWYYEPFDLTQEGTIFPYTTSRGNKVSDWNRDIRPSSDTGRIVVSYTPKDDLTVVSQTGHLLSLYFKVNENINPGDRIDVEYYFTDGQGSSHIVYPGKNLDYFRQEAASLIVAGGAPAEENHTLKSMNVNGSTGVNTYNYLEGFNPDITHYDLIVPNSVTKVNFSHELVDPTSNTKVLTGKINEDDQSISDRGLDVGDNYYQTVVQSGDGSTVATYTYKVKRLSNSAHVEVSGLDDKGRPVIFTDGSGIVLSDADIIEILVNNKGSGSQFKLVGDSYVSNNSVTIQKDLTNTNFDIVITPEDALNIYDQVKGINDMGRGEDVTLAHSLVRKSGDNSLEKVELKDGSNTSLKIWSEVELSGLTVFEYEVANNVDTINLQISPKHKDAHVRGKIEGLALGFTPNKFMIQVEAPDGSKKDYQFNITRVAKTNKDLKSLSLKVDGVEKNTSGQPVQDITNITVPYSESSKLSILAVANTVEGAKVVSGNINNQPLKVGENSFIIKVEAQDQSVKDYTVVVTMEANPNSDLEGGLDVNVPSGDDWLDGTINNPKDESVEGEKNQSDEFGNNLSIYRYTIKVKNEKTEFSLSDLNLALPSSAMVSGGEKISLVVGSNDFSFEVLSQDKKSTSRYIIDVIRGQNTVANVDEIVITSNPMGSLSGSLANNDLVYNVGSDVFEYTVSAIVSDGSTIDEKTVGTFILEGTTYNHVVSINSEDGKSSKDYNIQINRSKSEDASLAKILVSYGSENIDTDIIDRFINNAFTLEVGKDVDSIKILPVVSHRGASFVINNTSNEDFSLAYGSNVFRINVDSESGALANYTLRVNRAKNDDAYLEYIKINNQLIDTWNGENQTFTIDPVDEHTAKLDLDIKLRDSNASYTVNNVLNHGENQVKINVTAQDGVTTREYIINVKRALSSSADLGGETISPSESNKDNHIIDKVAGDAYRYTVYVPYDSKKYSKDDFILDLPAGATVTYDKDVIDLYNPPKEGQNLFKFSITSADTSTTKDYIIQVVHTDSSRPKLVGVSINGVDYKAFNPDSEEQTIIMLDGLIGENDDSFEFAVTTYDGATATISKGNNWTINVTGENVIKREVTLLSLINTNTNVYNFSFTRTKSSNANLSDIIVEGGSLTPSFAELPTGPFEVFVGADQDFITITPELVNANATVLGGGKINLVAGKNIVDIIVQSEDGNIANTKTYQVVVNKEIELKKLKLGEVEVDLSQGQKTNKTIVYEIVEAFDKDITEAFLEVVAKDPLVNISSPANTRIDLDNSEITFTLTAQDTVTKLDVILKYQRNLNSDASLTNLAWNIKGKDIISGFSPEILTYDITVDHDVEVLKRSDLNLEKAHVNNVIEAKASLNLSNQHVNKYEITSQAEDGTKLVYVLNISRLSYNFLEDLSISAGDGHLETSFNPKVNEYSAIIYPNSESFSFEWVVGEGVSVVNGLSLKNISTSDLPKDFLINVKGSNDNINTYKISASLGVSTRLESLESNVGFIDFDPDTYAYTVLVPQDATTVSLSVKAEDLNSTISGNFKNIDLSKPETGPIDIVVKNAGYESTYKVTFKKVDDLTGINEIAAYLDSSRWVSSKKDETSFEVLVDYGIDLNDLNFQVDLVDKKATYTISEPQVNGDGSHKYLVSVTDSQGITKPYSLLVKNDFSDNNLLKSLTVNGRKVPGFNPPGANYDFTILEGEAFVIEGVAQDLNATVTYDLPDPVEDGSIAKVIVTSEKGSPRIYTIKVTVEPGNHATLESLSVFGHRFSPNFDKNTADYYLFIPNPVTELFVEYTATGSNSVSLESNAVIDQNKVSNLSVGDNYIKVVVSSASGQNHTYTINVERGEASTSYLDNVVIKSTDSDQPLEITPKFESETYSYVVTVLRGQKSFVFEADYASGLSVYGLDPIDLTSFPYTHTIRVIDKNGIPNNYSFIFIEEESDNVDLANLWTSEGALSPVFTSENTSYNLEVENDVLAIDILYTKVEEDQIIENAGTHILNLGENVIEVLVSQGQAQQKYTITVYRKYDLKPKLDSLAVSVGDLSPNFDSKVKEYFVSGVAADVETINIFATSNFENAVIQGSGTKNLVAGSNVFKISVSDENGLENYYITVERGQYSGLELAYLEIVNEELNENFSPSLLEYTANLKQSKYDILEINATAKDKDATVTVSGNTNLSVGENEIVIRVSLSETEYQDTIITVTLQHLVLESNIHEIKELYIETVVANQSVLDVKNQMLNEKAHLKFYYEGRELSDNDLVGTGTIIKLVVDNKEYDSKIIIVKGDVNGDGIIAAGDIMMIQSVVLGGSLNEIQMIAAEVTGDGDVNMGDFMMIRSHIIGLIDLYEERRVVNE